MDEKKIHMEMIGQSHKTNVHCISIAWSEMGAGEPLILIHGFQDTHRVWAKVAPLLAHDFRVLMPDLPGSGLSDRPDAPYTLTWYARMVIAWMDAIGLSHAHICGHSFGGGIAPTFAHDLRDFLLDPYRPLGRFCPEMIKKGRPGIQGNPMNVSPRRVKIS
jgi:pimeloyl-ACP methyl ester carboxylesterase